MTKENRARPALSYFAIGTVALFLMGFLLLVIFGARIYRDTVAGQAGNNDTRAQLSYLVTTVRGNDSRGAVSVSGTAEAPLLVIRDGDSGYAFRVYLSEGRLVEDFAPTDAPLDPAAGQIIGTTNTFTARKDGALLRMSTDEGSVLVYLRGEGGQE